LAASAFTLQLLWGEYETAAKQRGAQPYRTASSASSMRLARSARLSMRQVHRPGEKLFLDYSGKKTTICDPDTGPSHRGRAVRRRCSARATTRSRKRLARKPGRDFCASTVRALEYFEPHHPSWCQTSFAAL